MKSLSDFKKRLKIGVKIHTIWHTASDGRDENGVLKFKDEDRGTREVSIVQTNSFALKTLKKTPIPSKGMTRQPDGTNVYNEFEEKLTDSWCQYPKASEVKIIDEDTIQIFGPDFRLREGEKPLIPILTYKFV